MNEGMQRKRRYLLCMHDMTFFASCCFLLSLLVVSSSVDKRSRHPCLAGMRCRGPRGPICAKTSSGRSWENNVLQRTTTARRTPALSLPNITHLSAVLASYRDGCGLLLVPACKYGTSSGLWTLHAPCRTARTSHLEPCRK